MYGDPRFIRSALRIYRANFDRGLHDPMLADLAGRTEVPSHKPLLLLGGADDGCLDPKLILAAQPDLAAGSRIEILENAGPFLHLERPAAVAELVLGWLSIDGA
jgi:pimeloyl-ACP methyl ester carboxylesterase